MHTRLTHVRANVRNLKSTLDWYCDVLGFEVQTLWPPDEPAYADFISWQGAVFALRVAEPVPTGGRFNFSVDEIDPLWERLRDRVDVVEPIYDTPHGTRTFTIRDPDGNELGFVKNLGGF